MIDKLTDLGPNVSMYLDANPMTLGLLSVLLTDQNARPSIKE